MRNDITIILTKKEIYSLINEKYLFESNTFSSALNKIKLIANKAKISFTKLKDFIKKMYSAIKEVPNFRIIGGVLLCTISLNMIDASITDAKGLPTFTNKESALEAVARDASNEDILISDRRTYVLLRAGNEAFRDLISAINSDGSVDVPRVPQAVTGIVTTNITFSNAKELSHSLENIWDKYQSTIDSNNDSKLIHITSKLNNKQVNFIFAPNPENITHEEFLEILKEKALNPPDDFKDNASNAIGKKAGNVNGFINSPRTFKEYGRWSFVAGKSKGSKATLLHEASHLFGIQKEILLITKILSKVEGEFANAESRNIPVRIDAIVNKEEKLKSKELTKWGDYELKNYKKGISKDDLINLIAKTMPTKLRGESRINAAEWVASIGLDIGKIKVRKVNGENLYLVVSLPVSQKLDYYVCPEETSRYYDDIKHFMEDAKEKESLSSFANELLNFYKKIDVEKNIYNKIENLKNKKTISVFKELSRFRRNLLTQFKEKIDKEFESNKKLNQDDREKIEHFYVGIIFFITKYYAQKLQSINAEGYNVFDQVTDAEEKINSLGVLDRFFGGIVETKKINKYHHLLQERIYIELLSHSIGSKKK
jgi:hypothetical protein